tara:strand:+ start:114 stop:599 length:486 start_codon:yes stop_codon:yes gene_type:complete
MSRPPPRNSIEHNEKKYPMMNDLFENIMFDKSIVSNKHKIINMKKLMRKYIDEVDTLNVKLMERGSPKDMRLPTNATHIWYEEAKKYKKTVNHLRAELKKLQDKDVYHKYFLNEEREIRKYKQNNIELGNENKRLRAENYKLRGMKPDPVIKLTNVLDLNY